MPDTGDGVSGQLRDYPTIPTLLRRYRESGTWACGRGAETAKPCSASSQVSCLALLSFFVLGSPSAIQLKRYWTTTHTVHPSGVMYRDLVMAKCTSDRWVTHITDPACLAFPCLCATIRRTCPTTPRPASTAGSTNLAPSRLIGPAGNGMRRPRAIRPRSHPIAWAKSGFSVSLAWLGHLIRSKVISASGACPFEC